MSSTHKNLSEYDAQGLPSADGMRFGIVVADWNAEITHALLDGCRETLLQHGTKTQDLHVLHVPGTFELPYGAKLLLGNQALDAVICLGCVITGETRHNEYISHSVAQALVMLGLTASVPCIFGVLTPDNMQQAADRAGGRHGNKGVEAAATAIQMAALKKGLKKSKSSIGF
ncbi:MAG: 6,7-dimethyl-8-ribityllumazine synthase [Saprospiraceae bacterium]|jgi:6,7-dimethyl-8-ribityllumazine synthase